MANITTQTIRVDLSTDKIIPTAFTHQNDTARTLEFSMYNKGVPYTMTGNTVKFAYKSPIVDGAYTVITGSGMASGTVSGNKVTVTLPNTYTAISGVGMLTMIITPTSGTVRPVNIRLVVQKSADGSDVMAGASDFPDAWMDEKVYSWLDDHIDGIFTEEQFTDAVDNWLDDHPEATTTVQDWSLTYKKLVKGTLGFVTPEMYGAKGNGVDDDTDAFNSMFESGERSFFISKKYLVGSNTGDAGIFSFSHKNNLHFFGDGLILDGRTPQPNSSAHSVFAFSSCNDVSIDLDYKGKDYEQTTETLKTTGYTFVLLNDCENVSINMNIENCRQGVQTEAYQGNGTTKNISVNGTMINSGYFASLYNCNDFSVKCNGEVYHRMVYCAGCNKGEISAVGKTNKSISSPVLLTDNNGSPCQRITAKICDTGSSYPSEVGLFGVVTQDTDGLTYSFDADIFIDASSSAVGVSFAGFSGNVEQSKLIILDKKPTSNYMTINTGRISGNVNGLIISVKTSNDINIGSNATLIDSDVKSLNMQTDKNITVINSRATNTYVSGGGTGKLSVINSDIKVPVNSFSEQFIDKQWKIGNARPTLTSTDFCVMYDTSINKLIVHQGNYWYELATRGGAVT